MNIEEEDFLLEVNGEDETPTVSIKNYGWFKSLDINYTTCSDEESYFIERSLINIMKNSINLYERSKVIFYNRVTEFFKEYIKRFKELTSTAELVWRVDVEEEIYFVNIKGKLNEDFGFQFLEDLIDDFKYIFNVRLRNEY